MRTLLFFSIIDLRDVLQLYKACTSPWHSIQSKSDLIGTYRPRNRPQACVHYKVGIQQGYYNFGPLETRHSRRSKSEKPRASTRANMARYSRDCRSGTLGTRGTVRVSDTWVDPSAAAVEAVATPFVNVVSPAPKVGWEVAKGHNTVVEAGKTKRGNEE